MTLDDLTIPGGPGSIRPRPGAPGAVRVVGPYRTPHALAACAEATATLHATA